MGLGATLNVDIFGPLVLRVYADAEWAWKNFNEGLGYLEPDRHLIVEETVVPQDPRTDLWYWPGLDVHASAYLTQSFGSYVSAGAGFAHNGHDGTSDIAVALIGHLTPVSELDLEFLGGGSWRMRLSVAFLHW